MKFAVGSKVKILNKLAFQTNQTDDGIYEIVGIGEDAFSDYKMIIYTVKCADGQILRWLDTKSEVPVGLQEDELEAA